MTTVAAQPEEACVAVVDPDAMDDDIFIRHMNARHAPVRCIRGGDLSEWRLGRDIAAVRAFHRRLHDIGVPNNEVSGHYHDL